MVWRRSVGDLLLRTGQTALLPRRYFMSVIVLQATAGVTHLAGSPLVFQFNPSLDVLRVVNLLYSVWV